MASLRETLASIRNSDFSVANTQDTSQAPVNSSTKNIEDDRETLIFSLLDAIEAMQVYKELRKIVTRDSDNLKLNSDLYRFKHEQVPDRATDSKCRLTFTRCISKIMSILDPKVAEFRDLRLM